MRHYQWVSEVRRPAVQQKPITTLGWTQFVIVGIVIAAVVALTAMMLLPFGF